MASTGSQPSKARRIGQKMKRGVKKVASAVLTGCCFVAVLPLILDYYWSIARALFFYLRNIAKHSSSLGGFLERLLEEIMGCMFDNE